MKNDIATYVFFPPRRYVAGLKRWHLAPDATSDGPLVPPDAIPDGVGTEDDFEDAIAAAQGHVYVLFPSGGAVEATPRLWMCPPPTSPSPLPTDAPRQRLSAEIRLASLEADSADLVSALVNVWVHLRRIREAVGVKRDTATSTLLASPGADAWVACASPEVLDYGGAAATAAVTCSGTVNAATAAESLSTNGRPEDAFALTTERKLLELSDPRRSCHSANAAPLTFIVLDGTYRQAKCVSYPPLRFVQSTTVISATGATAA